jgi:hypothetical protein
MRETCLEEKDDIKCQIQRNNQRHLRFTDFQEVIHLFVVRDAQEHVLLSKRIPFKWKRQQRTLRRRT